MCRGTRRRRPSAMLMNSGHQGLLCKSGQTKIVRDPGGLCAIRRRICGIRCQGGLHHPGENSRRRSPCAKMSSARRVTPGTRGCGPSATNRGHWVVSAQAIQSTAQVIRGNPAMMKSTVDSCRAARDRDHRSRLGKSAGLYSLATQWIAMVTRRSCRRSHSSRTSTWKWGNLPPHFRM